MEAVIEKECSALGGLFQTVIGDMKSSCPIWEDFITKAGKLQSQLRVTAVAVASFLDAFQKVADLATNSRGGTRDIGSALTRMCMRHRSIEAKLKQFSIGFLEYLINPLQEQMEEWKRGVNTLDKDHAKEYKRARQEIKKKSSDTLKLQKKAKKGRGDIQPQLDSAMQDVSDKYILLEETEKQALRKALIEERQRFCCFVAMLRPVVDEEICMLGEVTHLQAISDDLKALTSDPHKLPPASEQVIMDLKGSDFSWSYQTPPSSPSTTMSRKSSMCSSTLPQQAPARLSSISSHDSGFISSSQDQYMSPKSSSPMQPETKVRENKLPTFNNSFGFKYAHMLQAADNETHEELALALSRGLELDTQRSSRDSIQCSSGYSTQTNTPCCSEDTIPSQVSDYDYFSMAGDQEPEQQQSDFDKSSTIPRNSDISQSYRRMFQTKRPASTAGLSHNASGSYSTGHGPVIITPGVATIRRTPSSKPSARRSGSVMGTGPIPIRTPVIPVKIPTVPDMSGAVNGSRNADEMGGGESPDSPTFAGGVCADTLPVMSWSGQATTNPPTAALINQLTQQHLHSEIGSEGGEGEGGEGNMLVAIRKGVKLKRTLTNDRSAPRIA
uniref:Metastasis suppressor protein 1-like n=1 Tax=Scophthalmus maximus TaxID=52904 RepID=A0A8D3DCI6_SCOMX